MVTSEWHGDGVAGLSAVTVEHVAGKGDVHVSIIYQIIYPRKLYCINYPMLLVLSRRKLFRQLDLRHQNTKRQIDCL